MPETEALSFLVEMSEAPLFTPGDWVQLGIAEHEADQLIGDIGMFVSADGITAEIGFSLAPSAQGRGIATAAVRQALQLLFSTTSVEQVIGITDSRNVRSLRLLERVGFRPHERHTTMFRGEPCVEVVYVATRRIIEDTERGSKTS